MGKSRVTIRDIAREAGVSHATVSRALNNHREINIETRKRIHELARQMNYIPDGIARGLVTNRSNCVGMIIPDMDNQFVDRVVDGAEDYLNGNGRCMILAQSRYQEGKELNLVKTMLEPVSYTHLDVYKRQFRYTLYIFSGLLFTVIGAFLLYFIEGGYVLFAGMFSTYYISMSILLAFAVSYPDMRVLLYFVIPIKMKWMAFVYVAMIGYDIFNYVRMGVWQMAVPIVASLLNFIIFFLSTRDIQRYHPKEVKRRQEFKKAVNPTKVTTITKHKCAVCGRTERDGENLEFRFCSKCNGNYEYCQDHLYTHEHVK